MNQTITGRIKATTAWADPNRYGRSDRSATGRWFWEIDRVLLLLLAVLIGVGLIAVAAASPAAAQRYSGGSVRVPELYYFYRQIAWIALSMPVMITISMQPRERLKRISLAGALICIVALALVPWLGAEVNGAKRWLNLGIGQFQRLPPEQVRLRRGMRPQMLHLTLGVDLEQRAAHHRGAGVHERAGILRRISKSAPSGQPAPGPARLFRRSHLRTGRQTARRVLPHQLDRPRRPRGFGNLQCVRIR